MKIVFWSNTHAHSCTSCSAMAVAAYMAMSLPEETNSKISFLQTQFKYNNIDYPLLGQGVLKDDFFGTGIDALLSAAKSRCVTADDAYNASISLFHDKLLFYRSTRMTNKESFDADMRQFSNVVDALDDCTENVIIDLTAGINPFTTSVLKEADVVVVMLSQNQYFIQETLRSIAPLELKHIIYCIGNYREEAMMNHRNVQSMFHQVRNRLFEVPYDVSYADSISNGTMQSFLLASNIGATDRKNPHRPLHDGIQKGVRLIHKEGR